MGENKIVEYAADLPVNKFGSGFGRKDQKIIDQRTEQYLDHPWNMNNYHKLPNSLNNFQ